MFEMCMGFDVPTLELETYTQFAIMKSQWISRRCYGWNGFNCRDYEILGTNCRDSSVGSSV